MKKLFLSTAIAGATLLTTQISLAQMEPKVNQYMQPGGMCNPYIISRNSFGELEVYQSMPVPGQPYNAPGTYANPFRFEKDSSMKSRRGLFDCDEED